MAEPALQEPPRSFATESDQEGEALLAPTIARLIAPLASLKLTVVLFGLAIFIIFCGTLAQVNKDIWDAIHSYFRTPIAWIEFQIFFPPAFFPSKPQVPGGFYFPGGWLIGLAMVINLVAAHSLRFKVQARGSRLVGGLITLGVGALVTWLVILSGSNADGLQHETWISWDRLWTAFEVGIGALALASFYGWLTLLRRPDTGRWLVRLAAVVPAILAVLLGWLLVQGDAVKLDASGMRILWQLMKGGFASAVLLAGCVMLFKKRAGIVLLHGGILLMMFSELLVGTMAKEGQMQIGEGETVNFIQDIRSVELAMVQRRDGNIDDVIAIPQSWLRRGQPITHATLPCKVEVLQYFRNSRIRDVSSDDDNPADTGAGKSVVAVPVREGAGTDSESKVDLASAYVRFSQNDGKLIGTYLLSQFLNEQPLQIGDTPYEVSLRFERTYKPFQIKLLDVRKDDYLGTDMARSYSSDVHLVDSSRHIDRKPRIWMNNPLRFAGETFYQSNYIRDPQTGVETTVLAVVTNTGWMIPYVACMIVATGMLSQFIGVLLRFLDRRAAVPDVAPDPSRAERAARKGKRTAAPQSAGDWPELAERFLPVAIVAIFAIWLASEARTPHARDGEMNLYEFGKLPLVEQGRVKPFDTYARNSLRIISKRETFKDEENNSQPAIRWLMDMIARPEIADKHRVFRIENIDVLDTFKLERRKGMLYSLDELRANPQEFLEQIKQSRSTPPKDLSLYQRKLMEVDRKVQAYRVLRDSFRTWTFPAMPSEEDFKKDREETTKRLMAIKEVMEEAIAVSEAVDSSHPPLAIPVDPVMRGANDKIWQTYTSATIDFFRATIRGDKPNATAVSFMKIFHAYEANDSARFNADVAELHAAIRANPPAGDSTHEKPLDLTKTHFEAYFNHLQLPVNASLIYLVGFVLSCLAWLGWSGPLSRSALWLNTFTLALHTFAVLARIYISGRPPVTNLYSSAVFIGWAGVLLGLVLENIFRIGIGNVVSAVAGASTLLIAHFLADTGDTFTVLVAVLDTQFWLATHVVCITLGYATTFVAGLLGVEYILLGLFSSTLSPERRKAHARMIYGVLCFALFFSFVGTVLGGLWADDSWGRFWGWDPKENGALIIVLWNALVLHARWDGMAKDRGLAMLAVVGNIVTSWSWFGVNELGVGLHSYGFTEGVLMALGVFILTQLAIIALGSIPTRYWRSFREPDCG